VLKRELFATSAAIATAITLAPAAGAASIAAIRIVRVRIRVIAALIAVGARRISVVIGAVRSLRDSETAAAMATREQPVALARLGLRLIFFQISIVGHRGLGHEDRHHHSTENS
jgi:hypothetical protein